MMAACTWWTENNLFKGLIPTLAGERRLGPVCTALDIAPCTRSNRRANFVGSSHVVNGRLHPTVGLAMVSRDWLPSTRLYA